MSQVKDIQKSYDDLLSKAQALEAKVNNLQKTKDNLETDITSLSKKKDIAEKEYKNINQTVKDAIDIALEEKQAELDNAIQQSKSIEKQSNDKSAQLANDKKALDSERAEVQKRLDHLDNSIKENVALKNELHKLKDKLVNLGKFIMDTVNNA